MHEARRQAAERNRRTAFTLATIALAFFAGIVVRYGLLH